MTASGTDDSTNSCYDKLKNCLLKVGNYYFEA